MNKYKIIAVEKNYTASALELISGAAGSISHALAKVAPTEATALVEAMPESKIAERLLALADYIDGIEGSLLEPHITFVSSGKSDEEIQMELEDDILAIDRVASEEKERAIITYFAETLIYLRELTESIHKGEIKIVQDENTPIGVIKLETKPLVQEDIPEDGEIDETPVIKMHPATYLELVETAKREIVNQAEEQLTAEKRTVVDNIKLELLEKVIFFLFHAINTNDRLQIVKHKLGMIFSSKLDPSLVTRQDEVADPEEARELAEEERSKAEEKEQREEVKARTNLASKAKDALAKWLAEHPEHAKEFEGNPDEEGKSPLEEEGIHEIEEDRPSDKF